MCPLFVDQFDQVEIVISWSAPLWSRWLEQIVLWDKALGGWCHLYFNFELCDLQQSIVTLFEYYLVINYCYIPHPPSPKGWVHVVEIEWSECFNLNGCSGCTLAWQVAVAHLNSVCSVMSCVKSLHLTVCTCWQDYSDSETTTNARTSGNLSQVDVILQQRKTYWILSSLLVAL